jgi:hypothetical protein
LGKGLSCFQLPVTSSFISSHERYEETRKRQQTPKYQIAEKAIFWGYISFFTFQRALKVLLAKTWGKAPSGLLSACGIILGWWICFQIRSAIDPTEQNP